MSIKITTEFGVFEGRTIQSAARRGYGKRVQVHATPARVDVEGRIFDPSQGYIGTIYRIEGIAPDPLTDDEMVEVAALLDETMNWNGFIAADQRARLFALIDTPCQDTWDGAHSLTLLDPAAQTIASTLWDLLLACTAYRCNGRIHGEAWDSIPTRSEVITALRRAVTMNRAALLGETRG
ncbi:hypothetical protein GCM10025867_49260 (plasmid) [Frondihabitans sucicola]|uniref:Uncharacterized protein n=1 Tax=Frondihabitans sucicola TaxID=1268041 RepID=A0ABM8GW31_9MICO|nr:hypothetical protein [Frondihabitans sucicola]BDZ52685.1 hypothetical protein GCM10025867_49260 [Frondihabitans sucicola]